MTGEVINDNVLEKIWAFRGLNIAERHQLRDILRTKAFRPNEKVIVQGKQSQYLWFLLDGQCEVVRETTHAGTVVLAEVEPYSLFGEMSFFSPAPHSANVVAKTPVKLLSISRADYDDLVRDRVPVAYKLAYNIVEGVAQKLRHMDERVAELAGHHDEPHVDGEARRPDWRLFREKLLNGWNL